MRNYGGLDGLPELREIFAELLWVEPGQVVCGGNSSLTLMWDVIAYLLLFGAPESTRRWSQEEKVTFICPVPGYDRHFSMLADFGIEMVTVPMNADGPDVPAVEALVRDDPSVKGMWVVPTYANPSGAVCSQEVAAALASMPTAAPDFRIFWDNAYAFHHLTEEEAKSADILTLSAASGNPNRPLMFASTSKITYAGAGVSVFAASTENKAWYLKHLAMAAIGPDKVNHLRHVEFFGSADGVRDHMRRHREIIAPKFAAVDVALTSALDGSRRGRVDPPHRRVLRQPRRPRRHRLTGGPAGQGGRHRPHPGRGVVPLRAGPARPEHPAGADVPAAGPGGDGHGRRRHLRGAGRGGEAGRRRLTPRRGRRRSGTFDRNEPPFRPKPPGQTRLAPVQRPYLADACLPATGLGAGGRVAGMSDDQLQPDDTLDDKYDEPGHEDMLDGGYNPPDRPRGSMAWGVTAWEESQEETIEQRIKQEIPDPDSAYGAPDNESGLDDDADMLGGDDPDAIPADDDFVGDGGRQVGRLVAPDEGFGEDDEKDEVAEDVGFDGGVASPEESAMHIATDEPGDYESGFGTDDDGDEEGLTEATAYRIENEDPMNELDSLAGRPTT